mgnify:FL=1
MPKGGESMETPAQDDRPIVRVSLDELERNLKAYARRTLAGETIVVVDGGKPIMELRRLSSAPPDAGDRAIAYSVLDEPEAPPPAPPHPSAGVEAPTVSLRAVADEMDTFEGYHAYLNRCTGELVTLSPEELSAAEELEDAEEGEGTKGYLDLDEDQIRQAIEVIESDDWLELPDKYEIDEYHIMERFAASVEDERLSDELLYLIRGSGAFRRFKDWIRYHGIAEDWYRYRQEALEEIAARWLEAHHIPYTRMDGPHPAG